MNTKNPFRSFLLATSSRAVLAIAARRQLCDFARLLADFEGEA